MTQSSCCTCPDEKPDRASDRQVAEFRAVQKNFLDRDIEIQEALRLFAA
jgi:hypothetical protein